MPVSLTGLGAICPDLTKEPRPIDINECVQFEELPLDEILEMNDVGKMCPTRIPHF